MIGRAHGGSLRYQPRDGGGACFELRLPRGGPGETRREAGGDGAEAAGAGSLPPGVRVGSASRCQRARGGLGPARHDAARR
jgi:hypothetical protein